MSEQDLADFRNRLDERISTAGYPYPIDHDIAELRQHMAQIRNDFIWAAGRVVAEDPLRATNDDGTEAIKDALIQRAGESRREVLVESPYFIQLDAGIAFLRKLTSRGVKVRVLTNSAVTNDVLPAHAGYASTRKKLLEAGVELYELRPDSDMKRKWSIAAGRSRAALHSKLLVFDRETVFIGSPNLDPRSRALNTEIGVLIDSPEIARQMAAFVEEGMAPGSAYHLTLDSDGDLVWTADTEGQKTTFDSDPNLGLWSRLMIAVIGILPLEDYL